MDRQIVLNNDASSNKNNKNSNLSEQLVVLSRAAVNFKYSEIGTINVDALTLNAGGLISDLKCNSLVSLEKMPLVIASVLSLCFGDISLEAAKYFCPSSDTLSFAKER